MLQSEDLARILTLLDQGRAVMEEVGSQDLDRESARFRLAQLLGDAIHIFDGAPAENGGPPADKGGVPADKGGVPAENGGARAENGGVRADSGGRSAHPASSPEASWRIIASGSLDVTPPAEEDGRTESDGSRSVDVTRQNGAG